jgi:hypothetical protein
MIDGNISIYAGECYCIPLSEKMGLEIFDNILETVKLTFTESQN